MALKSHNFGWAYTPADPEFGSLLLPIRRTSHPILGEVDVKVDLTPTIQFSEGSAVLHLRYPGPIGMMSLAAEMSHERAQPVEARSFFSRAMEPVGNDRITPN